MHVSCSAHVTRSASARLLIAKLRMAHVCQCFACGRPRFATFGPSVQKGKKYLSFLRARQHVASSKWQLHLQPRPDSGACHGEHRCTGALSAIVWRCRAAPGCTPPLSQHWFSDPSVCPHHDPGSLPPGKRSNAPASPFTYLDEHAVETQLSLTVPPSTMRPRTRCLVPSR